MDDAKVARVLSPTHSPITTTVQTGTLPAAAEFGEESYECAPLTLARPTFEHHLQTDERSLDSPLAPLLRRRLLNVIPLAATDLLIAASAFAVASSWAGHSVFASGGVVRIDWMLLALLVSLALFGVYPGIGVHAVVEFRRLTLGVSAMMAAYLAGLATGPEPFAEIAIYGVTAWGLLLIGLPIGRSIVRRLLVRSSWWGDSVLVFGEGADGRRVYDMLRRQANLGMKPIGIVSERDYSWDGDETSDVLVVSPEDAPEWIAARQVTWGVIAHSNHQQPADLEAWQRCASGIPHLLVEGASGVPSLWTESRECGGRPAFHVADKLSMRVPCGLKRLMDVALIVVCAGLVVPLMLLLTCLVKWKSPEASAFYGQRRIGRGGRTFTAWKFRTMAPNADDRLAEAFEQHPELREEWERDHKLKKDPRVIPGIGTFLRKTSLDELPQLWNVLRGEMSLVGPRPIVQEEIGRYREAFMTYRLVRPGITGLWQVSGRNNTDYDERVRLDCYYIRNWSLWMDIHILARTIRTVLFLEGAY